VLRAVAGPGADLDAEQQRHVVVATEHVPGLADLVEHLVRGHPDEVGVHQLDHRVEPPVLGQPAAQAGERALRDRRAEHPLLELLLQALGGAPRATVEPVDVLAHDHDRVVGLHPVTHDLGDDVDELALLELVGLEVGLLAHRQPLEARQGRRGCPRRGRPGPATVGCGSAAGPACRPGPARPGRPDLPHGRLDRLADCRELVLGVEAAADEVALDLGDRVAVAPGRFFDLGAVAEGAARERAVLVEVAVGVGLDDGGAAAVAHDVDLYLPTKK